MAQASAFSPRTVLWLIAVGSLSFAAAAYVTIYGDFDAGRSVSADSFSYSAIGHRAFLETLQRLEVPVIVSRNATRAKAGPSSLLVVAEPPRPGTGPEIGPGTEDDSLAELLTAETLLLVLPKWRGRRDGRKPRWIDRASMIPRSYVGEVLRSALPAGRVLRPATPPAWKPGPLGLTPTLDGPQLIEAAQLTPILSAEQGVLVGELLRGGQRIWILSDPDVLSNHGLGRGDNAALAVALIEALRPQGGTVIFDETIHGFRQEPNLWRALFEQPFVVATLHAVVAVLALLWTSAGRFGSPLPAEPALKAGKATLLDNTASLLQYGGHGPEILRRYRDATFREVTQRLRAPRNLDQEALVDWVDRVGEARGVRRRFRDLRREVDLAAATAGPRGPNLLRAATGLYRWKQEIIHGS